MRLKFVTTEPGLWVAQPTRTRKYLISLDVDRGEYYVTFHPGIDEVFLGVFESRKLAGAEANRHYATWAS